MFYHGILGVFSRDFRCFFHGILGVLSHDFRCFIRGFKLIYQGVSGGLKGVYQLVLGA